MPEKGKLKESCNDCPWTGFWDGGPVSKDPGLKHARITGHTVTGTVADTDA